MREPSGHLPRRSAANAPTETHWLDASNARFGTRNGILYLLGGEQERRITAVRAFPFELLWEYISILDEASRELGMVRRLEDLDPESAGLLREELCRRYRVLSIRRVLSLKERYGFSYWQVETDEGRVGFTMHDTYRNILRVGEDRAFLLDVDGNRFEIPSIEGLDRKSLRRIELYL